MIRFDNVSKKYRRGKEIVTALDNVSLEVPKGALALVQGPSGSGKTTIINLAAGLARPSNGKVAVNGKHLEDMSPSERAALRADQVAVVFQMFHLVPYLSAVENVLLPHLAKPNGDAGTARERAEALLAGLGLAQRTTHRPDELSAGERQRCALARALFNKPDIILADEPTGNLDPESAERVINTLSEYHKQGATILLVSHHHIEAMNPDMEFHIRGGKLAE